MEHMLPVHHSTLTMLRQGLETITGDFLGKPQGTQTVATYNWDTSTLTIRISVVGESDVYWEGGDATE